MPLPNNNPKLTYTQETDTGTGSYGNNVSQTRKNGVNQWVNKLTGTTRYGAIQGNGDVIYGGNQDQLKKTYMGTTSRGSSSGSNSGAIYSGGDNPYYGAVDSLIEQIKALLSQQYEASKKMAEEQRAQSDKESQAEWDNNQRRINVGKMRTNNYLNQLYGNNEQGISNRIRNQQNWISDINANNRARQDSLNRNSIAYNNALANAHNQMTQGLYNYVLPIYTNRAVNQDNLNFQRSLL